MYLTRVFLDPSSAVVRADLRTPESLHKTVMRLFPNQDGADARVHHGILHRLDRDEDGRLILLVQSRVRPEPDRLPSGYALDLARDPDLAFAFVGDNPAVRDVSFDQLGIAPGARFAFRLRANTTRKIDTKSGPDGARRNGRRVPVRGDDGRLAWLGRRAEAAGFTFDERTLRVAEVGANDHAGPKSVTLAGALFEGVLEVRDPAAFRDALDRGIGPGKAYGFGLLSLQRLR